MQLPFSPLWVLVAVVAVVVVFGAGIAIKIAEEREKKRKRDDPEHRYASKGSLLREREIDFLQMLDPMADDLGLRVCPQVRLEDVIQVVKGADNATSSRNRIRAMHIDFVLVEPESFRVYACVELQDSSHNTRKRQEADRNKADALRSAGVPLLVFHSKRELQKRGVAIVDEA